ncbi:hypothetical protein ASD19_11780 [Microbacterium sp. Root53]|uniref:carboxylate-amine ligase n=1 Tax=Microbacterium sp. Root53 TaxID=1736553 RepID=UPI0006FB17CE|nr:glutamate--cysteine ligase [Microbacterium sp. Root53]KQZ07903.1 hypothetical protein ASD19_11780 [Microbacterium sp. Root53]
MRTFGVEEELLLVDERSGVPRAIAPAILRKAGEAPIRGFTLEAEMQQEMIEVISRPCTERDDLLHCMRDGRRTADALAREQGGRAIALAASPLSVRPHVTVKERYKAIEDGYAGMARATLECGFHVHTGIDSPDEGVAVLDRIRVWLPLFLALSANSAFREGEDTGYASFRFVVWHHWPTAGPNDVFGSVEAYRALERALVDTGAILDTGMLYFDARLSHRHDTVETRIADVCLTAEDGATLACLIRALVDHAADEWRRGVPPPDVPTPVIRLASWQAARHGVTDRLVDPTTGRPCAARDVIARMIDTVRPELRRNGDEDFVECGVADILRRGTGSDRLRAVHQETGSIDAVIAAAAAATIGESRG